MPDDLKALEAEAADLRRELDAAVKRYNESESASYRIIAGSEITSNAKRLEDLEERILSATVASW
jgi:hypothetical protein